MNATKPVTPASSSLTPKPGGLPTPDRYWAALGVLLAISITVLDSGIANIALPTIANDLGILPSTSIWIVNAYTITIIATLLPFSAIAERIGFTLMYRIGISIFIAGAIVCSMADSLGLLLLGRIIQGMGSSSVMCLFGGLVRNIYPPHKLAAGISLNAMTVGLMAVLSPSIGAFIITIAPWKWIFIFTIPFCFVALYAARFLPRIPKISAPFDYISALLNMLAFGLFIWALDESGNKPGIAAIGLLLSLFFAVLLIRRSAPQTAPLVPIDLFRIPTFSYAIMVSALTFMSATGAMLALPFYFQNVLGLPLATVGIMFSTWPIGSIVIAPLAARLSSHFPASLLSGIGAAIMFAGLGGLLLLPNPSPLTLISLCMFLAGMGFGFFQTPNNKAMLLSTPIHRSSATGGAQATTRLFGQGVGGAIVALCFSISQNEGAIYALAASVVITVIAVLINLIRYFKKLDTAVI
ncbi:MFS transporter [Advenella sp. RU8]|uniref:MFS transporter n=1 Tax=Advenella sp. RU8 TaxID=3399575 RepID=UPI003AB09177